MRHFLTLSYRGTLYHGWQRQPHSTSVQETLETALSTLLRTPTELTGCGRTDAGVHASTYVAHFDTPGETLPQNFLRRFNRMLPADVAVRTVEPVVADAHARFDATERAYRYDIIRDKDPFRADLAWHYHGFDKLHLEHLNAAAAVLLEFDHFAPFCKSKSDAQTMRCDLRRAEWTVGDDGATLRFHVAADRFLRGMVRLIVGACVQVGLGEMSVGELRAVLKQQQRLGKPVSVPARGLFLVRVDFA